MWLRLICGPRATSLAVCTIVVLLCHVCTSLCHDCTSVTTSLDDLLDTHLSIVFSSDTEYQIHLKSGELRTSGVARARGTTWGTKGANSLSTSASEQSKKRLLILIDKHGLKLSMLLTVHVTILYNIPNGSNPGTKVFSFFFIL